MAPEGSGNSPQALVDIWSHPDLKAYYVWDSRVPGFRRKPAMDEQLRTFDQESDPRLTISNDGVHGW